MKLVVIISNKGKSQEFIKVCHMINLLPQVTLMGRGTAPTEVLEALSLSETDKDVIIALAPPEDVKVIFDALEEQLNFTKKGLGVAFSVNLNGISSKSLAHLNELIQKEDL